MRLFQKKPEPVLDYTTNIPSGTAVATESGYYFIFKGKKMLMHSKQIFDSWNFPRVVQAADDALNHIPYGGRVGFRDGTAIVDIRNHNMYIISESKKRQILDPKVMRELNISGKDFLVVSKQDAEFHQTGEPLE